MLERIEQLAVARDPAAVLLGQVRLDGSAVGVGGLADDDARICGGKLGGERRQLRVEDRAGEGGESLERQTGQEETRTARGTLRRTRSEDLLVGPVASRSSRRRKRGEMQLRIVDFAHTTTGRDWLPYPPPGHTETEEVMSGKGYQAEVDPETGLIYARFPPHYPDEPDRGFLYGLMNLAGTLEKMWNEERVRRMKAARDRLTEADTEQLPPLSVEGKEVFDEIFRADDGELDLGMIST